MTSSSGAKEGSSVDLAEIQANPTKRFFIEMLIRDIELMRAIADLVDNSVDGARRMRGTNEVTSFEGLKVDLIINANQFQIYDNCGGISIDIARRYAFRFGRPEEAPASDFSVGQFGVGMKRAIFKLGRHFNITSYSDPSDWFSVDEDIDAWEAKELWTFHFDRLPPGTPPFNDPGTQIRVTSLNKSVKDDFVNPVFVRSLCRELEAAHQQSLGQGLAISVNGQPLSAKFNELLISDLLRPAYRSMVLGQDAESRPINSRLFAGVMDSRPELAGWDVFCNGRLVLEADQSEATGWGDKSGNVTIPKYHNQYARFKGFVFFDSADAGLLPWNTTKTGVDIDSPVYKAVRQQMLLMMRPVINFLNQVDQENDDEASERPLTALLQEASPTRLKELNISDLPSSFAIPTPANARPIVKTSRIAYAKPLEQISSVKSALGVGTLKEVGERTFDYFYEREIEE